MPPMPPSRPTPPMAQGGGQGPMSVQMPDDAMAGSAMPDIGGILDELSNAGVGIQAGPNGTLILSNVPAEVLATLGGTGLDGADGVGGGPGGGPAAQ